MNKQDKSNEITNLLIQLFEESKKSKKELLSLKNAAVVCQQYELAANIRQIETTLFPETEETKAAKMLAKELQTLFKMVELDVKEEICWLVYQVVKGYSKKKGSFSLKDAAKLIAKRNDIFTNQ